MSDLTNTDPAEGEDYAALLAAIRQIAGEARVRAAVGSHMVRLTMYWKIGREILTRQAAAGTGSRGYGARIIARLAADISADPALKSIGASKRNLQYMRKFAAAWPDWEKVQPAVALSSWKHQTILLDRLDDPDLRLRYAAWSAESGWSANTLALQIANKRHLSIGVAQARRTGHVLRRDHRPRGARRAQVRRDDRGRLRSGSTTTDPLQEYFNPATEEWIEYLVTGEESDGELVRYRWRRRRVRRMRQCRNGSRG